ncbi:hypothetical protein KM043_018325 [Ampulex compressa]|nr:hypothetical protein KM043_018325 [Ampulex compressa]
MQEFANQLPTSSLLPSWEENIRSLVPVELRRKYADVFGNEMNEIKERYDRDMHQMSIARVIAIDCQEACGEVTTVPPFKFAGKTQLYPKYLRHRCAIIRKYYLSHRLIRNIVSGAHFQLPEYICDFRRYHSMGFLDLNKFLDFVEADIKKGALAVTGSYYGDIVRLISQPRYVHDVPTASMNDFLSCATNLLALQIMRCTMNSIEHLLCVMSETTTMPLLKLELKCEKNELFIYPLIREIYASFHNFVNEIAHIGEQLPSLASWVGLKTDYELISVVLPEWYMEKIHRRLAQILENVFEPLNSYVEKLDEKFGLVYHPDTHRDIVAYVTEGHTFQECIDSVEDFNRYIREINGMPDNEYFVTGKLNQAAGKAGLVNYIEEVRQLIIKELVKRHRNYNLEICETFESLRERALNIPGTTKELLELGQYMTYVVSTLIVELRENIALSLRMMASLIGLTTLDRAHIELNNTTIHWLRRIRPVFEQNSVMYEQTKFELEEKLQNKVEILGEQVEKMFPRLEIMDDMDDAHRIREYIEDMRKFARELERMECEAKCINDEETLFQFPLTQYPRVNELKDNIMPYYALIYRGCQWQRHRDVWLDGPFEYLDAYAVENKATEYFADFTKISKQYKTRIKMQIATGYLYTFAGSPDDPDPSQQPAPLNLCFQLIEDIKWFKQYVPLLTIFRNPAMRQNHWDDMSVIASFDLTPNAGTSLRKIINMNLMKDLEKYELISISATKELMLENSLAKMISDWDNMLFSTMPYKDSGVNILTQLDDIQALLEEQIVKVQAMRGSAFVKPIEEEVKTFYHLLIRIQSTIEEWTKVQVQWMYLLPIFSSKDIVAQLPEEDVLFTEVHKTFRRAMQGVAKDPRVRETAGSIGLLEMMEESNAMMERVNDGVLNYLEKKRLFFPRFFFLSNDDMLEILSETKEPLRVQPHLKKCFEGINRLGFDEDMNIFSMISDDKEEITLQEQISTAAARGCVEKWLLQVEEQMVKSVRHEILMSYLDYEVNERVTWVRIWPGMVVLCVSQIYWSIEVQNCLMTHIPSTLETLYEKLRSQILDMVNLVKGQLSKQNRTTLNALITIDVHAMDVVKLLIDRKIINEMDFEWLAQLRYYWEDDVIVRIIYTSVPYAYEYLGNCPRLVITPLTDRCYRTLIGAYSLHLNGAPEGPAGTGKTETTKDLSRAIAVQCVVFNCSEGLDYKNMGKFFKGLASCGAWSCFDEFNRIELEVLSVVAQQILCIVQAVRAHAETFVFEGTELKLNPAVYVCITMNPGYAGRTELPDNLKVLFRTVAMMVPDYAMIAEIFLYSSGFSTARELSTKIVTTYKLCSEQLSSQSHYDYGMRAVKAVLTAAQNIKLKHPDDDEAVLLLRSLVDVNLPKFLAHDVPLFQGIISDLFPGLSLPVPSYDVLLKAVREITEQRNLQAGWIL